MSAENEPPLRLAVIGTPRSGNTWVRLTLARLYGLAEVPVHAPDEVGWGALPPRCVIQIHWYPEPPFLDALARDGVRVVAVARHPLDVMISWLNLQTYAHLEGRCHGAGVCRECAIAGQPPRGEAFLDYVRGEKGRHLWHISPAWWGRPGVLRARYEDLVADPVGGFGRLGDEVGGALRVPLAEALAATSIGRLKPEQEVWQYQLWQGRPGLWRSLLPAAEAGAIAEGVPGPFAELGYPCDPDDALDPAEADRNWLRLQLDSTRENLALERAKHRNRVRHVDELRGDLELAGRLLAEERRAHEEALAALAAACAEVAALSARPAGLRGALRRLADGTRRLTAGARHPAPRGPHAPENARAGARPPAR